MVRHEVVDTRIEANFIDQCNAFAARLVVQITHFRRDIRGADKMRTSVDGFLRKRTMPITRKHRHDNIASL